MPAYSRFVFNLFFLFFLFLKTEISYAQSRYFENYSVENGIPSNEVYDIIEDDFGFLWISTDKGLSRYDGYEFKNFGLNDGLLDAVIYDFFKDDLGRVWCTSNSNNLFFFEGLNPYFQPYEYNDTILKYAKDLIPNGMLFSPQGEVYISFYNTENFLQISNEGEVIRVPGYNFLGTYPSRISIKNQTISFFTNKDVQFINSNIKTSFSGHIIPNSIFHLENAYHEKGELEIFGCDSMVVISSAGHDKKIVRNNKVLAVGVLDEKSFWVGYARGGGEIINSSGVTIKVYLKDLSVSQMYKDSQGNIWISTLEKGLFRLIEFTIENKEETLDKNIHSISHDKRSKILFGDIQGDIYMLSDSGLSLEFEANKIHKAYVKYNSKDSANYFASDAIFSGQKIYKSPNSSNHLSIVKGRYLLHGIFGSQVTDVITGKEINVLYKGLRINDVVDYNQKIYGGGNKGLFVSTSIRDDETDIVFDSWRINDLEVFGNYLLLGTNGFGVIVMNSREKVEFELNENSGLSSNFINKIVTQNDSTVWVATNQGVSIVTYSTKGLEMESLSTEQGLQSNEIRDVLFFNDTAWIATSEGLNTIDLLGRSISKQKESNLGLIWADTSYSHHETIPSEFNYSQNDFEFQYSGIRLKGGQKLRYSYQLKGYGGEDWIFTENRKIQYTNLPSGDYVLTVRLHSDGSKTFQNSISYKFIIHEAYWNTWWFITVCCVLGLALVYFFFKIRVLTYNADIVRSILRAILKRVRAKEHSIIIRQDGESIRVKTNDVHYIKTDGNYLEIYTTDKRFYVRSSIAKLIEKVPDKIEFTRVHRAYVVRIDKIQSKGNMKLTVLDTEIPIGRKYSENLRDFTLLD